MDFKVIGCPVMKVVLERKLVVSCSDTVESWNKIGILTNLLETFTLMYICLIPT